MHRIKLLYINQNEGNPRQTNRQKDRQTGSRQTGPRHYARVLRSMRGVCAEYARVLRDMGCDVTCLGPIKPCEPYASAMSAVRALGSLISLMRAL